MRRARKPKKKKRDEGLNREDVIRLIVWGVLISAGFLLLVYLGLSLAPDSIG